MSRALILGPGKPQLENALAAVAPKVERVDLAEGPDLAHGQVPTYQAERETLRVVDAIMARRPFTHIVASSEWNLAFAATLRSRYDLDGLHHDQALAVTNKWVMKRRLGAGLATTRCWLSGEFLAGIPHPPSRVVVKPVVGASSKGVLALDRAAAETFLRDTDQLFLVEEAVPIDDELHCDGVVREGKLVGVVPSLYTGPVLATVGANLASLHLPSTDWRHALAMDAVARIVATLDLPDYVFHLELFHIGGRLLLGEIGLRPVGGGVAESLQHFFGLRLWEEFVALQLGRPGRYERERSLDHRGYPGALGVAVDPTGRRRTLSPEELLAVPGVVDVLPGHQHAEQEARSGSGSAFAHVALLEAGSETHARDIIAEVTRRGLASRP